MPTDDTYDYIVTGAGSAGCVVAARPSESGRYRVLLLEAGGEDRYPWIHVPMGYGRLFSNPRLNWMYESEPEPELEGRSMYQPRGKVLGGTSSINGMVYMRGNPADYDEWRQRGCTGWDWDSVLPYFKKAEDRSGGRMRSTEPAGRYASPISRHASNWPNTGSRRRSRPDCRPTTTSITDSKTAPGHSRPRPIAADAGALPRPICARRATART